MEDKNLQVFSGKITANKLAALDTTVFDESYTDTCGQFSKFSGT